VNDPVIIKEIESSLDVQIVEITGGIRLWRVQWWASGNIFVHYLANRRTATHGDEVWVRTDGHVVEDTFPVTIWNP